MQSIYPYIAKGPRAAIINSLYSQSGILGDMV